MTTSSADLQAISNDRPELRDAVTALRELFARKPKLTTIDQRTLLREVGGDLSIDEIVELLHELRERGLAKLVYRIKDNAGHRTTSRFESLAQRPEYATDREGQSFEVSLENIEQTYELPR